jgi:Fe-S cluster biogenesis protein NfuA
MAPTLRDDPDQINEGGTLKPREGEVRAALDALRPGLIADGGNIELLAVEEDGTVWVELQGACKTCRAAALTLRLVIEPGLREALPGVSAVVVA